jgi:hypothetical protein
MSPSDDGAHETRPPARVLLLEAEFNWAFRSMARTIVAHLEEGQLRGGCRKVQTHEPLGSVVLEALADDPERKAGAKEERLRDSLLDPPPDAIVAFDSLAGVLARRWAEAVPGARPLTVGVVGSLWTDPLWHRAAPDRLILPDESMAHGFHHQGRASDALIPVGLGVCGRFGAGIHEGRSACRLSMGLPLEAPTLLLATETLWADDVVAWMRAAADGLAASSTGQPSPARPGAGPADGGSTSCSGQASASPPYTLLVDAAGDRLSLEAARKTLEDLGLQQQGRVFGRVEEAGAYWGAADRVVSVALDHLVTRALTCRCPFWAIRPADERQRGILRALEALGAGEAVADPERLRERLAAGPGWTTPLDASRLDTVATPAVLPRIAEMITQLVLSHAAGSSRTEPGF